MTTDVSLTLNCKFLPSEQIFLRKTMEILRSFRDEANFFTPCSYDIISSATGEVIGTEEISRAISIIDGILNTEKWEIRDKPDEEDIELPF